MAKGTQGAFQGPVSVWLFTAGGHGGALFLPVPGFCGRPHATGFSWPGRSEHVLDPAGGTAQCAPESGDRADSPSRTPPGVRLMPPVMPPGRGRDETRQKQVLVDLYEAFRRQNLVCTSWNDRAG
jgi:hypothetical protein